MSEKVKLKLKKDSLKINATLASIFSFYGLNPMKTLTAISEEVKKDTFEDNVFYVELDIDQNKDFIVNLLERPDSHILKGFLKKGGVEESELKEYAQRTLHKSRSKDVESRMNELKGIIGSFKC